jgi:REP element-mobilizing transposase RayT
MPDYRRNRVPGGTYFFTVNLLERKSDLLIRHIDELREAIKQVRLSRPFHVDAWVVLPEHMHCIWTLPDGDDDYSFRWKAIKIRFAKQMRNWNSMLVSQGVSNHQDGLAEGAALFRPTCCFSNDSSRGKPAIVALAVLELLPVNEWNECS